MTQTHNGNVSETESQTDTVPVGFWQLDLNFENFGRTFAPNGESGGVHSQNRRLSLARRTQSIRRRHRQSGAVEPEPEAEAGGYHHVRSSCDMCQHWQWQQRLNSREWGLLPGLGRADRTPGTRSRHMG